MIGNCTCLLIIKLIKYTYGFDLLRTIALLPRLLQTLEAPLKPCNDNSDAMVVKEEGLYSGDTEESMDASSQGETEADEKDGDDWEPNNLPRVLELNSQVIHRTYPFPQILSPWLFNSIQCFIFSLNRNLKRLMILNQIGT